MILAPSIDTALAQQSRQKHRPAAIDLRQTVATLLLEAECEFFGVGNFSTRLV